MRTRTSSTQLLTIADLARFLGLPYSAVYAAYNRHEITPDFTSRGGPLFTEESLGYIVSRLWKLALDKKDIDTAEILSRANEKILEHSGTVKPREDRPWWKL